MDKYWNLTEELLNYVWLAHANDKGYYYTKVDSSYPFCDLYYTEEEKLVFEFALAGFKKENLSVELNSNNLIVKGSYPIEANDSDYIVEGIKKSEFNKVFSLPEYYHSEPEVSFDNGILKIVFSKDEKAKKKLLEIK